MRKRYRISLVSLPLIDLWERRSLILHFSWLNLKIKYKGSYLGLLWIALEPALIFTLLYTVFTSIKFATEENFGIYLLSGIIVYNIFNKGTMGGLSSIRANSGILKSLNIPKEFFPVTSTVSSSIIMIIQIGVFFLLMPFFGFIPSWTIVFLPLLLVLLLILILGLSYLLSMVNVFVKDIQPIWGILILALFFLSPIFWNLNNANEILLNIHAINPLGQLIELSHKIVVFGQIPSMNDWLYATATVLIVFFIGYAVFHRFQKYALERL